MVIVPTRRTSCIGTDAACHRQPCILVLLLGTEHPHHRPRLPATGRRHIQARISLSGTGAEASVQEQAERAKKKQAEKDAKTAAKQKTREEQKAKKETEIQKPIEERNTPVVKTTQKQAAIDIMSDPNIARQYFMGG